MQTPGSNFSYSAVEAPQSQTVIESHIEQLTTLRSNLIDLRARLARIQVRYFGPVPQDIKKDDEAVVPTQTAQLNVMINTLISVLAECHAHTTELERF